MSTERILLILGITAVCFAVLIACLAMSPRTSLDDGYEETNRLGIHETGLTLRTTLLIGVAGRGQEIFQPDSDIATFPAKTPPQRLPFVLTVAVGMAIGIMVALLSIYLTHLLFPNWLSMLIRPRG